MQLIVTYPLTKAIDLLRRSNGKKRELVLAELQALLLEANDGQRCALRIKSQAIDAIERYDDEAIAISNMHDHISALKSWSIDLG